MIRSILILFWSCVVVGAQSVGLSGNITLSGNISINATSPPSSSPVLGAEWLNYEGNLNGSLVTTNTLTTGTVGLTNPRYWLFQSQPSPLVVTNFHYTNFHFTLDRQISVGGVLYTNAGTNSVAYTHDPKWELAEFYFGGVDPPSCSVGFFVMLGPYDHSGSSYDLMVISGHTNGTFLSCNLTDGGTGTNYFLCAHGQGSVNTCGVPEAGCRIPVLTNVPYWCEMGMLVTNSPCYGSNEVLRVYKASDFSLVGESIYPVLDTMNHLAVDEIASVTWGQFGHPVGDDRVSIFGDVIIDRLGRFPMRQ